MKFFAPDFYISQLLTGHGDFNANLAQTTRTVDPLCDFCLQLDTVEHTLLDCPVVNPTPVPNYLQPIATKEQFVQMRELVTLTLKFKEELHKSYDRLNLALFT